MVMGKNGPVHNCEVVNELPNEGKGDREQYTKGTRQTEKSTKQVYVFVLCLFVACFCAPCGLLPLYWAYCTLKLIAEAEAACEP